MACASLCLTKKVIYWLRMSIIGEEVTRRPPSATENLTIYSVGGGFVVNERTRVDGENLYYKGVDKRGVHGARLHHGLATGISPPNDPDISSSPLVNDKTPVNDTDVMNPPIEGEEDQEHDIPYPFSSGNSLLALTRKHNVCFLLPSPSPPSHLVFTNANL